MGRGAVWRIPTRSGIVGAGTVARVKQLFGYVVEYLREDFHPGYYSTIAVFLLAAFSFNFAIDFKLDVLNPTVRSPLGIFWFSLFYGVAYYFAAFTWAYFHRDARLLRSSSASAWRFPGRSPAQACRSCRDPASGCPG